MEKYNVTEKTTEFASQMMLSGMHECKLTGKTLSYAFTTNLFTEVGVTSGPGV